MELKVVAKLRSGYTTKFGTPRQSGLIDAPQEVVFEPEYKDENMLRGITEYSHLWLIWGFSEVDSWSPTVRPPRLGGNVRVGVFATRSPFRPNPLGLTLVKLEGVEKRKSGLVLKVKGADMVDGTPIYDIKPYLPYVEAKPCATGGFSDEVKGYRLEVDIPDEYKDRLDEATLQTIKEIIASDPRPSYQTDEERVYGFEYGGCEIKFVVKENVAYVKEIKGDG